VAKAIWRHKAIAAVVVVLVLGAVAAGAADGVLGGFGGASSSARVPVLTRVKTPMGLASGSTVPGPPPDGHDVVTWAAAPADMGAVPGLGVPAASAAGRGIAAGTGGAKAYRTVCDVVHTSVGGWNPRIRLSNMFGSQPVTFDAADVTIPVPEAPPAGTPAAPATPAPGASAAPAEPSAPASPGTPGSAGAPNPGSSARAEAGSAAAGNGAVGTGAAADGTPDPGAPVTSNGRAPERRLTFGGHDSVTVAPGAEVLSDPVPGYLPKSTTLSVTLHVAQGGGQVTGHPSALSSNYLSAPGNFASAATSAHTEAASWQRTGSWYYLDGITVTDPRQVGTIVTVGDSITDGVQSIPDGDTRWPDDLARRLENAGKQMGVANEGLASNRITANGVGPDGGGAGISAEGRFSDDVLSQPGVTTVILLEGINDIGDGTATSARQLIDADAQLIARAHADGLRVIGATVTPFQGAGYYSPVKNQVRERLNQWIRTSGAFDGVADFDRAVRDPADPLELAPAYDSGDHLHPSFAGYQAMADSISLSALTPSGTGG